MEGASILLVGGLERMDGHYRSAPDGVAICAVYIDSHALERRAETADAIVLVTGHVSHAAALKARTIARRRNIPLVHALTPSLSSVRNALANATLAVRKVHAQERRTA